MTIKLIIKLACSSRNLETRVLFAAGGERMNLILTTSGVVNHSLTTSPAFTPGGNYDPETVVARAM